MTRPRLPSMRGVLPTRNAPEQVERVRAAFDVRPPRPLNPKAVAAVQRELERDPDATSAAVCRAVPLRKQDVFDALRELRVPGNRFP